MGNTFRLLMLGASLAVAAHAAKTLDIYFIDVEGGTAILFVAPSGESMLIDTGYPDNDRDATRINTAARAAGLTPRVVENRDLDQRLGPEAVQVDQDALSVIAMTANGDARSALNLLELSVGAAPIEAGIRHLTAARVQESLQRRALLYDKNGEEHYNLISALHKSMRNSDPDAAVYWLARMVEAGEDPLYIARRLVRFASEDVGNADPQALSVAIAAKDAVHFMGMPEGNTALAQLAIYLATAPKSNAVYAAYNEAARHAHEQVAEPVPLHLRNAPTRLMKQLEYGKGYRYAHDEAEGVADMSCLPPALAGQKFYRPTERGFEKEIKRRLDGWELIKQKRRTSE